VRAADTAAAPAIPDIHLIARRDAMPYLHAPHSDVLTRDWFSRSVGNAPTAWWVAMIGHERIVGYMLLYEDNLDHLYVLPDYQRLGIGTRLLNHAKALSPHRLRLYTFQRNAGARAFYEAHGFHAVTLRDGSHNEEEEEPDVEYEWRGTP
jgi:ribosomal protein S18 acetylase RimI-like enzyme